MTEVPKGMLDLIKGSTSFLVTSHLDPDGDAVGCQLAIYSVLKRLGKDVKAVSEDGVPPSYAFLEGAGEVITSREAAGSPREVAIVVDAAALERIGWVADLVKRCGTVVNIDHHRSNDRFGDLNLVVTSAGACGEIVYRVLADLGVDLVLGEAESLYTAILSDTGCFRFPTTTAGTLKIAAHLLEVGVKTYQIASQIYWRKPLASLKILGDALSSIEVTGDGSVATMEITRSMYLKSGAANVDTEGFANYPRSIDGVAVGVLLRETEDGFFRVSLRAAEGYDVDAIARVFGGGGHPTAAGFRIAGNLEEIKGRVRREILSQIGNSRRAAGG
ncbi:MAG: bifunctional oligoribonuclease/PAP phosphatase NrnA [bacterium]